MLKVLSLKDLLHRDAASLVIQSYQKQNARNLAPNPTLVALRGVWLVGDGMHPMSISFTSFNSHFSFDV